MAKTIHVDRQRADAPALKQIDADDLLLPGACISPMGWAVLADQHQRESYRLFLGKPSHAASLQKYRKHLGQRAMLAVEPHAAQAGSTIAGGAACLGNPKSSFSRT